VGIESVNDNYKQVVTFDALLQVVALMRRAGPFHRAFLPGTGFLNCAMTQLFVKSRASAQRHRTFLVTVGDGS
jgi:hypothetical protein